MASLSMAFFRVSLICLMNLRFSEANCLAIKSIPQCKCKEIQSPWLNLKCEQLHSPAQLLLFAPALHGFKLNSLKFSNSVLRFWPLDMFNGAVIKELHLDNCEILILSEGELFDDKSIEQLLAKNTTLIEKGKWKINVGHLKKLKRLQIRHKNNIPILTEGFSFLLPKTLKRLELIDCGVELIDAQFFTPLRNVEHLDLQKNKLERFPDNFEALPLLVRLNLRTNQIKYLPEKMAEFFPKLKHLILDYNKISSLSRDAWKDTFKIAETISLSRNPLLCDNAMKWIVEVDKPKNLQGICDEPEKLKHTQLRSLTADDFKENF